MQALKFFVKHCIKESKLNTRTGRISDTKVTRMTTLVLSDKVIFIYPERKTAFLEDFPLLTTGNV